MSELTLEQLWTIMTECAGEPEGAEPGTDVRDIEFGLLGYDSLALLETAARLERDYGIRFEDEVVLQATTPQSLLDMVNRALPDAA
ncbi:acyl carrier protein [Streptomyces sp. SudanB182_2057]|uniref:acyl carrier protein n=1 Tax=Streptomyces sp. SudanB182_2057 TaxID=3035281 RepID=UPI003F556969